ncbi:MAG: M23 family metallopeptidase [Bacillota bacterium]
MGANQEQDERLTIKIVPHSIDELISFEISKNMLKLIISLVIISIVGSSLGFLFYYQQNKVSQQTIARLRSIKDRNQELKNKLYHLAEETKTLEQEFKKLEVIDNQIKRIINYNQGAEELARTRTEVVSLESTSIDFNQKFGIGPNLVDSYIRDSIDSTEERINKLKSLFPQKKEELKKLKESAVEYKDYLASKPTGWPVKVKDKRITSEYGYRTHPVTNERIVHEGIDIGVWYGTEVYATGGGKVVYAGWKVGYGKVVIIEHGHGFRSLYAHNRRLNVEVNQKVERGDLIAYSGNSGRSTGPHLHYEVLVNGNHVNPMDYIKLN